MAVPRKPTDAPERDEDRDQDRDQDRETTDASDAKQPPDGVPKKPTGKTLQELERIQFDVLDRMTFDR